MIEDISPQAVGHDSGGIVASTGRHSFVYARGGRTVSLAVEPLDTYYVRLPDPAIWSDGTALSPDEVAQLVADVTDTFSHWGERCEIVPPDDPRVLHTLDEIVTYLRAEAIK